ncbi:SGNH/GDSL hydrolase family protein [Parapedobacter sp. 10938]|uniref:SGNH/GDSL hydrolase family protein n=1 Tax=Parapedobacter flavus TaxID=3110225 RepID=UPI002DB65FD3|nr:SGNH/GDSL hydrolase family protein [Parapedobacter sp. 10938]MEC3880836.1 SGNH/GDSL hydrolase family protein [Parapedobacter sp. 10938]
MDNSRRKFLGTTLAGAALAISLPEIVKAATAPAAAAPKIRIAENDVILFQGDSITDAGRDKKNSSPNNSGALGHGYALLAAASLLNAHAAKQPTVYNKGISGNKVHQLDARWEEDCITIKPNILSILIGVNDYWHTLSGNYDGTIQVYRDDFRKLLDRTMKALPDVKLIIGEPFAVNNVKAVTDDWFPAFDEYRAAAREIADEYRAVFIPYQRVFDEAAKKAPASYWTGDGVHTTLAGAQLMAEAWLQAVK